MMRRLGSLGLAASVLWAVISLIFKSGIGVTHADGVDFDFNITGAKAEITHETANMCLTPANSSISCFSPFGPYARENGAESDSYEILANLALFNATEFEADLNNRIEIALVPASCGDISDNPRLLPLGTWTGFIPGSDLHRVVNKNFTIYNFEANIPTNSALNFTFFAVPAFSRVELNLKIPTAATTATLSLEGNANLCAIAGPSAFAIYILDPDGPPDFSCVNIAPEFDTLDISQAFCPLIPTT